MARFTSIGDDYVVEEEETLYPRLYCPADYHQVGQSCYAISFFRALGKCVETELDIGFSLKFHIRSLSIGFAHAAEQCRSQSGGHLAVLQDDKEEQLLKEFLRRHIVQNIHPHESVSLWIGATFNDSQLVWMTGNGNSAEALASNATTKTTKLTPLTL